VGVKHLARGYDVLSVDTKKKTMNDKKNERYQEGDVVEVHERWAYRNNTVLKQVITGWLPLREKYIARPYTGVDHHPVPPSAIKHRLTPVQERDGKNTDYL